MVQIFVHLKPIRGINRSSGEEYIPEKHQEVDEHFAPFFCLEVKGFSSVSFLAAFFERGLSHLAGNKEWRRGSICDQM